MKKQVTLSRSEWLVMEHLWLQPHTLMELVAAMGKSVGWSKSTVATMVRRMEEKNLVRFEENGRTKTFYPTVSREEVAATEMNNLLQRAYRGSMGLMVSAMVQTNELTKEDIDELYEILKKAEEATK